MSTPLSRAFVSHDLVRCQQLMLEGADALAQRQTLQMDGKTLDLLEAAIVQSWAAGVDWLLEQGVKPKSWHLESALLVLANGPSKRNSPDGKAIVEALLDAGAPVEPRALWCSVHPRSDLETTTFERLVKNCKNWPVPQESQTIGTLLLESRHPHVAKRLELLAQAGPVFTETTANGYRVWQKLVLREPDGETSLLVDLVLQHQGWRRMDEAGHELGEDMTLMVQRFPGCALAYIQHPKFPWTELDAEDKERMLVAGIHNSNAVFQWVDCMLEAGVCGDRRVEVDGETTTAVIKAIQKACRCRDDDIMAIRMGLVVQALMEHGVDPNRQTEGGGWPMQVALAGNAARPVLEALIRAGGRVEMEHCNSTMEGEKLQWLKAIAQQQSMEKQTPAATNMGRQPRL